MVFAIQFNGIDDYFEIVDWMRASRCTTAEECRYSTPEMSIQSAAGRMTARPGDWIVMDDGGNFGVSRSDPGCRRPHVLLTPKTCPCRNPTNVSGGDRPTRCNICDGGLAICSACGYAEVELERPCPGRVDGWHRGGISGRGRPCDFRRIAAGNPFRHGRFPHG